MVDTHFTNGLKNIVTPRGIKYYVEIVIGRKLGAVVLISLFSIIPTLSATKPVSSESNSSAQVCFSASEAGRIAESQVNALQAIKRLRAELDLERAKRPARFGWTIGAGMGVGWDLQEQQMNVEPFVGVMWGIRF